MLLTTYWVVALFIALLAPFLHGKYHILGHEEPIMIVVLVSLLWFAIIPIAIIVLAIGGTGMGLYELGEMSNNMTYKLNKEEDK